MISQTAEYALRAIVFLADRNDRPCTNARLAEATQIPEGYLAKVMQILGRAELVFAQRGLKGGFTLAYDANDITVLEVVNAVDPVNRIHACPLGFHGVELCLLHQKLDDVARAAEETFGKTTIADILAVPRHRRPLCPFPFESPDS
ncbi:MAG: Rrf2 family transcriptional regulator [Pirellulales bacterium]|jgi:Rrf2 family protein|nr:Rrf2 family transcriptional regulator [Pirellulales bacterium]